MATAAQPITNQTNAQSSTGLPTVASAKEGKSQSSQNARTHGLSAKSFVILPGQEAEFANFESALHAEFQPEGIYQDLLFKQILHASWNLERCWAAEAQLLATAEDPTIDPLLVDANASRLRLIALYANRAERSRSQAIKELCRVQTEARYRQESCDAEAITYSPLVDTQSLDKQGIANIARQQQAALNQVRALMEAPTPGEFADKTGPNAVPGQTKPMSMGDLLVMRPAGHR